MKDARFGEEIVGQLGDPRPCHPIPLTTPKRGTPAVANSWSHAMVGEEARDNLPQPTLLFGDRLVHTPPHLLLDLAELGPIPGTRSAVTRPHASAYRSFSTPLAP